MARKQTDSGSWTVTNPGLGFNSVTFNETFNSAPVETVVFNKLDKRKSMIDSETAITTTGCDIGAEDADVRYVAKEPGYDSGSTLTPEMDSGLHTITAEKVLESITFNGTFSNAPVVVTGYQGDDALFKGGKTSAANITTTGCDVASEAKGTTEDIVAWMAIYTNGFWE